VSRLPSQRERGAELNRILRGETKAGVIQSRQDALLFILSLLVGLACWGLVGGLFWLIWRAL
jgi:hypothetical protein